VLEALEEAGFAESTLVLFLSDNGMSFPFAKANCYLNSTRTPWIVRWPGRVNPGAVNRDDLVTAIDVMPTFLEAASCPPTGGMDGRSFLNLLWGKSRGDREEIFTEFHETSARRRFPMRAVMTRRFGYLVNFWADGVTSMTMDSTGGMTFRAMREAARTDSEIARRVELFSRRVREEFFDFSADPDGLHNLIGDPRYAGEIRRLRSKLEDHLARIDDPALEAFRKRDDPEAVAAFMERQRERSKALNFQANPKI
jgi:N-sulfoglucosamine sulfohydrolase